MFRLTVLIAMAELGTENLADLSKPLFVASLKIIFASKKCIDLASKTDQASYSGSPD